MKKNESLFCSGDSNSDPNRKTDKICALDIKDYTCQQICMREAEESRL